VRLRQRLWENIKAGARLALFMRVRAESFHVSPADYSLLIVTSLAAWLIGGMARHGFPGVVDTSALTLSLAQIPIVLVVCLLAATLLRNSAYMLAFATAFTASDPVFEIASVAAYHAASVESIVPVAPWVNAVFILWALAVVLRAQWVVSGWHRWRSLGAAALFTLLLAFFVFSVPRTELWMAVAEEPEQPGATLLREDVFHSQPRLLEAQIAALAPERKGVDDLYFIGAAPYALQETFARELATVSSILAERFDTANRSVLLVNHATTLGNTPIASGTHIRSALEQVGRRINADEDMVMLFVTTHGHSDGRLAFEMPPLTLSPMNPTMLARMLADSGIKWKIIVISACYSGHFIEPLRDDNTLIITAADADSPSFGCEFDSEMTWFSRAFFDEALRATRSFATAFDAARKTVAEREAAAGYKPSNPQMHMGSAMKAKLEALEMRLHTAGR
jgi:hypothetical protein